MSVRERRLRIAATFVVSLLLLGGSTGAGSPARATAGEFSEVAQSEVAPGTGEDAPSASDATPDREDESASDATPDREDESATEAAEAETPQLEEAPAELSPTEVSPPGNLESNSEDTARPDPPAEDGSLEGVSELAVEPGPSASAPAMQRSSAKGVTNTSPCAASGAAQGGNPFSTATLHWGVKESYRHYVSTVGGGNFSTIGSGVNGEFDWSNGVGQLSPTGESGSFGFGVGNGVQFWAHDVDKNGEYALDQTFTNPCVEIVSDSQANLYFDVHSREFAGEDKISGDWFNQDGVRFATIALDGAPVFGDNSTTWAGMPATLTSEGSIAFGGYYSPGEALDPVSFSVPFRIDLRTPTSVKLSTSHAQLTEKAQITLTAATQPKRVAGSVTFSSNGKSLGSPVRVKDGVAILKTTSLPFGTNKLRALFSPDANAEFASSRSSIVEVTVNDKPAPNMDAGLLEWGVKESFRKYVVGRIASGKITVQKPATVNSAQSVYRFPQAVGGNWNGKTGTVQFAGNVNFYGHHGAMNVDLANPVITVRSATQADISVNHGNKMVVLATIDLGAAKKTTLQGGAVRFSSAKTTLTKAAAENYFAYDGPEGANGFYSAGAELDPLTFTIGKSTETNTVDPGNKPKNKPKAPAPKPGGSAPVDDSQSAGALSWGISSAFTAYTTCANKETFGFAHCAKGDIATNGVGAGYLFPQATGGSWDKASQTGTVNYSGTVTFRGYGMTMFEVANPSITVTGAASATLNTGNASSFGSASYGLDLANAAKQTGPNGEVTWSGVQVQGSLDSGGVGGSGSQSIGFDPLTFTVGAPSGVSFGSTQQGESVREKRTAAATAPSKTGINVITDAAKIKPGGRIELEAGGFEADDEGVLVVLYGAAGSEPLVLDEEAKADKSGAVTWSGTLPRDVKGIYTITLQGSVNAGAVIGILDAKKAKKAQKKAAEKLPQADPQAVQTAGVGGSISGTGGMSTWEWWASAGGLVVIAACMTLLVIRQRRLSQ